MTDEEPDAGLAPTLPLDGGELSTGVQSEKLVTGTSGMIADRYEVVALLGVGGMGHVYKARDVQLNELVALKTLSDELSQNPDAIDRFRAEVKLARRVTHPNVARTYDIGNFNGHYFLTMELIEGHTLDERMRGTPRLKVGEGITILLDVARGLQAAHRVGVIHRDLKPQNILLGDRVVISDFGIARARDASGDATGRLLLGTPAYMSPEQVQGVTDIDGRADLFALGVIAFELLTGKLPWSAPTPLATALSRVVDPPLDLQALRPDLPAALHEVIVRSIATDREARFADVGEWIDAINRFSTLDARSEASLTRDTRSSKFTSRTPRERASERTVAVIGFRSRGEGDTKHLAEGLTEEIIDELSMSAELKVRPRGAVAALGLEAEDPETIGRELGVQVVVQGSLRIQADRLRVRVALISVEDGFQIWANRFEGTAADLLDMSINVAEAVSHALLVEREQGERPGQSDAVAVDLYMRARYQLHLAWHGDIQPAIDLFRSALERAPQDPRILAGAATAYARAGSLIPREREHYLARAEDAAREAIELFERLPEAHIALSAVHRIRGDRAESLRLARDVLDIAPGHSDAQFMVGQTLLETGPLDTAIAYLEASRRAAPNLPHIRIELARARALQGDWDEVDKLLSLPRPLLGTSAGVFALTQARLDLWHPGPARWPDESAPEMPGHAAVAQVTVMFRSLKAGGEFDLTHDEEWVEEARNEHRPDWFLAMMHQIISEMAAFSGDLEGAMRHAVAASAAGSLDIVWLQKCPLLDDLRGTPRFVEIFDEVKARAVAVSAPRSHGAQ